MTTAPGNKDILIHFLFARSSKQNFSDSFSRKKMFQHGKLFRLRKPRNADNKSAERIQGQKNFWENRADGSH
jgi:hypothetical protein